MNRRERDEFLRTIYLFKAETSSELSIPDITWEVKNLYRLEVTLTRLNTLYCNGDIQSEEFDKKSNPIESKVKQITERLGFDVRFNGDPRGCAICIILPSGRYNSWDGETWRLCW